MALLKINCPECNAKMKSASGFNLGEVVSCPKCETDFTVRAPKEDEDEKPKKGTTSAKGKPQDEDEKPTKKKKAPSYDEDDEPVRSYKNSPLRYAVLGVLVVTMLVLSFFLYQKWQDDKAIEQANAKVEKEQNPDPPFTPVTPNQGGPRPGGGGGPNPKTPPNFNGKAGMPGFPGGANPKMPPNGKMPPNKGGDNPGAPTGGAVDSVGGFLGGGSAKPEEVPALTRKFTTALVGTWVADLGGGDTEELTYTPTGTFTTKLSGTAPAMASGKYTVQQLVGKNGLRIRLDDGTTMRTITVTFDGDELEHPSLQPGVTGTFRKK